MLRRGMRVRARVHVAALLTAAVTLAAAVLGTVFVTAAQESIARDTLSGSRTGDSALRLQAELSPTEPTYPPALFSKAIAQAPRPDLHDAFPRGVPEMSLQTGVEVSAVAGEQPTRLVWRAGACDHLRILAGRCATAPGEALVSRGTVDFGEGWRLGASFAAEGAGRLHVVGVYEPRSQDDPYWADRDYFDGGLQAAPGLAGSETFGVDSVFVPEQEFIDHVPHGVSATIDYLLDVDASTIGDGTLLRRSVAHLRRSIASTDFTLQTGLDRTLRTSNARRGIIAEEGGLVALQLVLLGSIVLFFLVSDLTDGRRREIALAKLRGQSWPALFRFVLAEPLVVLLAAVPLGIALGWLGGAALAAPLLRPGTPVALPPAAFAAMALALLGALTAAVLSTRRVLARPVLEQWSDAERVEDRAGLIAGLVVALALALAAALALVATPSGSPVVVLAPALILVAAAVIGVRVMAAVAGRAAAISRASPRIARFLAVRQLARSSPVRRTAMLLVITIGLAVFAVGGQSVLAGNRSARAQAELGAWQVVPVGLTGGADPVAAVERADPGGTWAMAAARWLPDGGQSVLGTVLAVDPGRLATVGLSARGGAGDGELARAIRAGTRPAVRVEGDRLTVRLLVSDQQRDDAIDAAVALRSPAGLPSTASLGPLRPGAHDYSARVACARGCTLQGFTWSHSILAEGRVSARVAVQSVSVELRGRSRDLRVPLDRLDAWRAAVPVSESSDHLSISAGRLTDRFSTASGGGGIDYAETPLPAPAAVSPGGLQRERPSGGWSVEDAFGNAVAFQPVVRSAMLPNVLDAGVLMDVRSLDGSLPGFASSASWQVWLSRSAPPDALVLLRRAGLVVGTATTVDQREAALAREGPGLAFSLLLALAVASALLAVLATGLSVGAAGRGRVREAAAVRLLGIPARTVSRAATLQQVLLLAASVVFAAPTAAAVVLLVLPQVRESASASPVPLAYLPDPGWLAAALLVCALLVGLVGVTTAVAVTRAAAPRRLREVDA